MNKSKILVIGGNDAGLSAAGRAQRRNSSLDITVLEKTAHSSYASCGLPYYLSGQLKADQVSGPDIGQLEENRGFKILTNHQVLAIDITRKMLTVRSLLHDQDFEMDYNQLIIATGATPILPGPLKNKAKNKFVIRSYKDAQDLDDYIRTQTPKKVMVIGASYLGLEFAEALDMRGLEVTLIEMTERLFPSFPEELSNKIATQIPDSIDLRLGSKIESLDVQDDLIKAGTTSSSNETIPIDLVVVTAGIRPNVEPAKAAGLPTGQTGALLTNKQQQTRRLGIYAAGDCVESVHQVSGKPVWSPFAGVASKQGRVAGDNVAGGRETFPGVLNTSMVRVFGLEMGQTGLNEEQAIKAGFDPKTTVITHISRSEYMPKSDNVTISLISDRRTKRLLGAQVIGRDGAGHRLNILATAIAAKLKAKDLAYLDIGYYPGITPIWDPVLIAGNVALK